MEAGRRSRVGCWMSRLEEMGVSTELIVRLAVSRRTATYSGGNIKRPDTAAKSQTPGKLGKGCFRQNLLSILLAVPVITTNCFLRV